MTLTSHHHHWNAFEAKGKVRNCQSHCNIDPRSAAGGGGGWPDAAWQTHLPNSSGTRTRLEDISGSHFSVNLQQSRKPCFPPPLEGRRGCTGCLPCRGDKKVAVLISGRKKHLGLQEGARKWIWRPCPASLCTYSMNMATFAAVSSSLGRTLRPLLGYRL